MTDDEQRDGGVLAGLPASRPQRRSRRRADDAAATEATPAEGAKATNSVKVSASAQRGGSGAKKSASRAKGTASAKPATSRAKRSAPEAEPAANGSREGRIAQPGQPAGVPRQPRRAEPPPLADHQSGGVVETAVQAAGELAGIGLTVGGQFVRGVLSRLPRP